MEYLSLIANLLKWLLIVSTVSAAVVMLIGIFHPLTFRVKFRASILGQRAEIWGSYLFGILNLGVVATPNIQDVSLKIFSWKKLLRRNRRLGKNEAPPWQPPASPPPPRDSVPPDRLSEETDKHAPGTTAVETKATQSQPETADNLREKPATQVSNEPGIEALPPGDGRHHEQPAEEPEITGVHDKTPDIKTTKTSDQLKNISDKEPETVEPIVTPAKEAPVDATPLKPLHEVTKEQTPDKQPDTDSEPTNASTKKTTDDWRARARKFRRDFSNRYRQLKSYLRLFSRKWRVFSPVLSRFWARGKQGFKLHEPALKLRYALHEPYITGMFHGSMSIFSGLANRFGVDFIPVPAFGEPGVYAKGRVTAVIRPWKFMAAMLGLLLERDLYREVWTAFKWYRRQRQQA